MLPRVILHNAISLDGRIDGFTPDLGQFYGLAANFHEDASLAGSDTLLTSAAEAPPEDATAFEITPPQPGDTRPLLVVPDTRGRVRHWHFLRQQPYWRCMVALCSRATPPDYFEFLRQRHVDAIVTGDDRVDLRVALEELNSRYDVKIVRVDSGGTLNNVLLRAGLVNEISLVVHPCLAGDAASRFLFRAGLAGTLPLQLTYNEKLAGGVIWLRYSVTK